jgi:hypothetical protein
MEEEKQQNKSTRTNYDESIIVLHRQYCSIEPCRRNVEFNCRTVTFAQEQPCFIRSFMQWWVGTCTSSYCLFFSYRSRTISWSEYLHIYMHLWIYIKHEGVYVLQWWSIFWYIWPVQTQLLIRRNSRETKSLHLSCVGIESNPLIIRMHCARERYLKIRALTISHLAPFAFSRFNRCASSRTGVDSFSL